MDKDTRVDFIREGGRGTIWPRAHGSQRWKSMLRVQPHGFGRLSAYGDVSMESVVSGGRNGSSLSTALGAVLIAAVLAFPAGGARAQGTNAGCGALANGVANCAGAAYANGIAADWAQTSGVTLTVPGTATTTTITATGGFDSLDNGISIRTSARRCAMEQRFVRRDPESGRRLASDCIWRHFSTAQALGRLHEIQSLIYPLKWANPIAGEAQKHP